MKKSRKLIALGLAAIMALAPTTVFADGIAGITTPTGEAVTEASAAGTATGDSHKGPVVDKDVFNVILPTQENVEKSLSYYMDPQGNIASTGAVALSGGGITIDSTNNNGVLFPVYNTTGDAVTKLSGKSGELEIVNKGTAEINVKLEANVTPTGGAVLSPTNTFAATDTATKVYFKLGTAAGSTGISTGTVTSVAVSPESADATNGKATIEVTMAGVAKTAYEVTVSAASYQAASNTAAQGYVYQLKSATNDAVFTSMKFYVEGACNTSEKAKWTGSEKADIELVWTLTKNTDSETTVVMQFDGDDIYFAAGANDTDTFPADATLTSMVVYSTGAPNGKNVLSDTQLRDGYVVYASGSSLPEASDEIWTFKFVVNGKSYKSVYPTNAIE